MLVYINLRSKDSGLYMAPVPGSHPAFMQAMKSWMRAWDWCKVLHSSAWSA